MQQQPVPVSIYYAYAEKDEGLRLELEKHLSNLRYQGLIADWHPHKILPGSEREQALDEHLNSAKLILLLLSPDFMASDYCYGVEMQRAMERFKKGEAFVIPIKLRSVDITGAPFEILQCLPDDGRSISQWEDQDEALLNVVKHIRRVLGLPVNEPLHQQRGGVVFDKQMVSNRRRFLRGMRSTWIKGVLEDSLYHDTLIVLGLKEQPDALANPFRLWAQETDREARELGAGTRISQVYDEADGTLLILGEPGAGKTTLLLELTRDLLLRAEADIEQPMPVVFPLASWTQKSVVDTEQPMPVVFPLASRTQKSVRLEDWLVKEFGERYKVSSDIGNKWLASEQVILLLDGLDEIREELRSSCVAAINQYRSEHPGISLVVSSRRTEYLAQERQLDLRQAIIVQPLTDQQIDEYVSGAGSELEALSETLKGDSDLRELARAPLMLNILSLAYQGCSQADIAVGGSSEQLRDHVFTNYVGRMFKRRRHETRYSSVCMGRWLCFLARYMKRTSQTTFFIERLSSRWFAESSLYRYYRGFCILICCLSGMFLGSLSVALVIWRSNFLNEAAHIEPSIGKLNSIWLAGLLFGLVGTIISILNPTINPILGIDKREILSLVYRRKGNLFLIVLLFLIVGLIDINVEKDLYIVSCILVVVLSVVIGIMLAMLFNFLLEKPTNFVPGTEHIKQPNYETRLHRAIMLCVIVGLMLYGLVFLLGVGNRLVIILTWGMALIFGLGMGGLVVIQHYVLRFLLWRAGWLPWGLVPFLEGAVERIFLRRVGGGYIFVHRLLLDYFAGLDAVEVTGEEKDAAKH